MKIPVTRYGASNRVMVRLVSLFALFSFAALGHAQLADDRLGLSRDQILKMGDDKWFSFYEAKKGDSAESLIIECNTYAHALHEQNEERLKYIKNRDRLERWISAVTKYGEETFKIQSRNGEATWKPVYAGQGVDIEELLDHLINLEAHPDKTPTPNLSAAADRVKKHHEDIAHRLYAVPEYPDQGIPRKTVKEANDAALAILVELTKDLLKTGGQEAFAVLVTCSHLSEPNMLFGSE